LVLKDEVLDLREREREREGVGGRGRGRERRMNGRLRKIA
jgi:hypothetical protein